MRERRQPVVATTGSCPFKDSVSTLLYACEILFEVAAGVLGAYFAYLCFAPCFLRRSWAKCVSRFGKNLMADLVDMLIHWSGDAGQLHLRI